MSKFAVNAFAAVSAAILVASLVVSPAAIVPEAKAEPAVQDAPFQPDAIVKGTACSSQSWPHYEHACQFDLRDSGATRVVRMIALR